MLLTSLQSDIARPHLGRIELACRVGVADIRAQVLQAVKELANDAEVPGFRKGKAPLKRVQAKDGFRCSVFGVRAARGTVFGVRKLKGDTFGLST